MIDPDWEGDTLGRKYTRVNKHDAMLSIMGLCSEVVFGHGYLHYGYWPEGNPDSPTVESLARAQERYFENLLASIPDGVETILDVGSGTGSNAAGLSARGFRVDCISPSLTMNEMARRKLPASATVHDTRFEDFDSDAEYDLVLFCESFHYLNWGQALENARRHAARYVLIFDYFRIRDGQRGDRISHRQFTSLLAGPFASDFATIRDDDVTAQVLPTFHVVEALGNAHVKPFVHCFVEELGWKNPFYALFFRWLRARIGRKASSQVRRHEAFAKEREYRLVLLEKTR